MIEEEACRFVVGSIDEKLDLPDEAGGIRLGEALTVGRDVAVGIGCTESLGSTVRLASADVECGVNKQVLWLSVGFLSILLLLSVPYLVERFEYFLSPQRVLDEYVDKGNNHFDWTYEDISQLQLQKKSDVDERSGSGPTPKDIVKKFGKAQSGNLAPFLNQTDGRMSLFYSREEPRQRLSFYFEKINNEYQLSGIYSYNLASSQHAQSRTDLKEENFEHLVLGKEFQNEDGTSYQEILEKFGLSKYIKIDSGARVVKS